MQLSFKSRRLARECNEESRMVRKHGSVRAKLLKRRLAQLRAAETLAALMPPYSGPA
jgi:proteic killer suppression protein